MIPARLKTGDEIRIIAPSAFSGNTDSNWWIHF